MKKFHDWLKYTLKVLTTPECWVQKYSYSEDWDKRLLLEMRDNKFVTRADNYCAKIGVLSVGTAEHPFASFTPYKGVKTRPSRKTILMAYDKLIKDSLEETKS